MTDRFAVHLTDCVEWLRAYDGPLFDSCVTDPPYGLGFMGKEWDNAGVAFDPETWRAVFDALKPGAYLVAFSGTRTYHHMACAIEDAGFEIRDQLAWVYGSGFPKSMDVSKAIDKTLGAEGSFGGPKSAAHAGWIDRGAMRGSEGHEGYQRPWMADSDAVDRNAREYLPRSDEARQWQGWGTALKPAWEPICFARKPLAEKTVAKNVLEHGTGAIHVDACRVGTERHTYIGGMGRYNEAAQRQGYRPYTDGVPSHTDEAKTVEGRFPANFMHDGSEEVLALFPGSKGQLADVSTSAPSSRSKNVYGAMRRDGEPSADSGNEGVVGFKMKPGARRNDDGSAARFFYCAKASKKDRNAGGVDNNHPTVKPTDLMRWLCRLVTPPEGRVLDPFCGSGSTGRGAVLEGFGFTGLELTPDYMPLVLARIQDAADEAGADLL